MPSSQILFSWIAPLDLPALVTTVFLELSWLGRDLFVHLHLSYYGHWLSGMLIRCAAMISDEFHIFIVVVSEPWKELVYVTECKIHAPALNPENHSTVFFFFFRACTICNYKEVKLLGYCVIPKRREVLRTLENCRRNESTSLAHLLLFSHMQCTIVDNDFS